MRLKKSIRRKLVIYMAAFLVVINLSFWVFYYASKQYLDEDLGRKLIGVSRLVASGIKGDYLALLERGDEKSRTYRNIRSQLERAERAFSLNKVLIAGPEKRSLVDSGGKAKIGDPVFLLKAAGEEVGKALAGEFSSSLVYRGMDGSLYKSAYAPIRNKKGDVVAVLVVEASAAFLRELETFRNLIVVIAGVSFVAVLALGLLISRSVVKPIHDLVRASKEIKKGGRPVVSWPGSDDEVGYLVGAFNEMAHSIKQKEDKLRELYMKEARRVREVERYAEYILGSIANGIISVDGEGVVRVCNAEACRILGEKEGGVTGKRFDEVESLRPLRGILRASLRDEGVTRERQIEYVNSKGESFSLSVSCSPSREASRAAISANMVLTDQTMLISLQEEIKRKETLAAVGELAAHIAHEVRNPLGSMKIYMDLLSKKNIAEEKRREFVEKISSEISRLDDIVGGFLHYSAPSRLELSEFALVDVIKDAVLFAHKKDSFERIELKEHYGESGDLLVRADKNQLMQMFLNLLINARDAMPKGGAIEISVGVSEDPAQGGIPRVGTSNKQGGIPHRVTINKTAVVTIRDTGSGISPEDMDRIFDPFFTTKANGTGLGLALVRRVVDNHGGRIEVISTPGEGTAVVLSLPVCV